MVQEGEVWEYSKVLEVMEGKRREDKNYGVSERRWVVGVH
jgi:hypothetical protein